MPFMQKTRIKIPRDWENKPIFPKIPNLGHFSAFPTQNKAVSPKTKCFTKVLHPPLQYHETWKANENKIKLILKKILQWHFLNSAGNYAPPPILYRFKTPALLAFDWVVSTTRLDLPIPYMFLCYFEKVTEKIVLNPHRIVWVAEYDVTW